MLFFYLNIFKINTKEYETLNEKLELLFNPTFPPSWFFFMAENKTPHVYTDDALAYPLSTLQHYHYTYMIVPSNIFGSSFP